MRELKNFVFRLALMSREEEIDGSAVASLLRSNASSTPYPADISPDAAIEAWLDETDLPDGEIYRVAIGMLEAPLFRHVLARTGGNQLQAARLLGINRNTLRKRLSDLSIDPDRYGRRD